MEIELREPIVAYGKNKFTIEEYLQTEEASDEKYEYCRGKYSLCEDQKSRIIPLRLT